MILDVLAGLVLLGGLAAMLSTSLSRTARARDRLAAERSASRELERALVDLSMARPVIPAVTVTPDTTAEKTAGNLRWVRVSIDVVPGRRISLLGTAPARTERGTP